jgi:hypothetical protein
MPAPSFFSAAARRTVSRHPRGSPGGRPAASAHSGSRRFQLRIQRGKLAFSRAQSHDRGSLESVRAGRACVRRWGRPRRRSRRRVKRRRRHACRRAGRRGPGGGTPSRKRRRLACDIERLPAARVLEARGYLPARVTRLVRHTSKAPLHDAEMLQQFVLSEDLLRRGRDARVHLQFEPGRQRAAGHGQARRVTTRRKRDAGRLARRVAGDGRHRKAARAGGRRAMQIPGKAVHARRGGQAALRTPP